MELLCIPNLSAMWNVRIACLTNVMQNISEQQYILSIKSLDSILKTAYAGDAIQVKTRYLMFMMMTLKFSELKKGGRLMILDI